MTYTGFSKPGRVAGTWEGGHCGRGLGRGGGDDPNHGLRLPPGRCISPYQSSRTPPLPPHHPRYNIGWNFGSYYLVDASGEVEVYHGVSPMQLDGLIKEKLAIAKEL